MAVVVIVFIKIYFFYHQSMIKDFSGYVFNYKNEPIEGVQLKIFENVVITGNNGSFKLNDIDLSNIQLGDSLYISAKYKSFSKKVLINIEKDDLRNIIIQMPGNEPIIRVTYKWVGDLGVDYLMRGKIKESWSEILGGQPIIIKNSVYKTLSNFRNRYIRQHYGNIIYQQREGSNEYIELERLNKSDSYFVGSWTPKYFKVPLTEHEFKNLFKQKGRWNGRIDYAKGFGNRVTLSGFADKYIFNKFRDDVHLRPWIEFYNEITHIYFPYDFCFVGVTNYQCGEGTYYTLYPRSLNVFVAIIENVTSKPLSIGDFVFKENKKYYLRMPKADSAYYKNTQNKKNEFYTREILLPKEKILIPLKISFRYDEAFNKEITKSLKHNNDQYQQLQKFKREYQLQKINLYSNKIPYWEFPQFYNYGKYVNYSVPITDIIDMLSTPIKDYTANREYIYGPSFKIDSIYVDGFSYPLRGSPKEMLMILAGDECGSCPYIYLYEDNKPVRCLGHVLYGKNTKEKEGWDKLILKNFDGRLLIKEEDDEVSYIDIMMIKGIKDNGDSIYLYPKNKLLEKEDGKYVELHKGMKLKVDYDIKSKNDMIKYELHIKGYYIPIL